ncbi:hypothetical protein SBA5_180037 [Candidatus Sulfotelmatomonas gaucii]|uniref:Uncharacterized protein n=1 Tax=Candidatus Sulfuritelmatomonas gaucii TaxID=2043161 RepID=A0A2N9L7F9_9BACT|nr:hypothetical protein SBA5_180037 [Candidatus Sulfotelmatomonas gaucii]
MNLRLVTVFEGLSVVFGSSISGMAVSPVSGSY